MFVNLRIKGSDFIIGISVFAIIIASAVGGYYRVKVKNEEHNSTDLYTLVTHMITRNRLDASTTSETKIYRDLSRAACNDMRRAHRSTSSQDTRLTTSATCINQSIVTQSDIIPEVVIPEDGV